MKRSAQRASHGRLPVKAIINHSAIAFAVVDMVESERHPDREGGRAAPRSTTILSAVVQSSRRTAAANIRNLSCSGAMVEVSAPFSPGEEILLRRGSLEVEGTVAWCINGRAGINFRENVVVQQWVARQQAASGQTQVDQVVNAARSNFGMPRAAATRPSEIKLDAPVLNCRIAEEILLVARMIEQIGEDLANEPLFIARHGQSLQQMDVAIQALGHLARVISAEDANAAICEIGMQSLAARLLRRSL